MVDQELLEAISKMIDQKLAPVHTEIKDSENSLKAYIELDVISRFNLVAENQQIMMEKLQNLDDLEVMDTRITALEAMVKKINRELKELKKAE